MFENDAEIKKCLCLKQMGQNRVPLKCTGQCGWHGGGGRLLRLTELLLLKLVVFVMRISEAIIQF